VEATTPADKPAAPAEDMAAQVKRLVHQLDAAELAEREAAEQQLVELGPPVLDLLPTATSRMSAEAKERLGRVRDKLERAEAEGVAQASLVTLTAENQLLSKVLSQIEEQTGNKVVDYREQRGQPGRDPNISVSLDKVPFWQALDTVLDEAGSTIEPYAEDIADALAIIDRSEMEVARRERPAAYAGPFRLEGASIESTVDFRNPAARTLNLELSLAWEPRLRPITIDQPLANLSAEDESGSPIAIAGEGQSVDSTILAGMHATEVQIPLVLPERSVERIASLKGKFTALLPGRIETFRFEDLKKSNQQRRRAGVAVTLESVRKNNEVYEVRVRVRFDEASGALQSHLDWVSNNEAYLEGPDKDTIMPDGQEKYRETEDEFGMAYYFGLDGKLAGHTFVYKTPAVIVEVPVEYEIKDLPLP
jgi:hypothetical protein